MSTTLKLRDGAAPPPADPKAERRQRWLERVQKELAAADDHETHHAPGTLAKHLDHMVEAAAEAEVLTQADKNDIRDRVRTIKLTRYERFVDHLLDAAITATRDSERQLEKVDLLKQINEAFAIAIQLGASQAIRDSIKQRLDIIRDTSAAGDSAKAKEEAEREAARREAVHPKELRTFTRWREPPLMVVIGGRCFTTSNWSLSGILIDAFDLDGHRPGDQIEVMVGLTRERLYKERIEIVRYSAEARQLAVKSRRFASVLMQVKRDCDAECGGPM